MGSKSRKKRLRLHEKQFGNVVWLDNLCSLLDSKYRHGQSDESDKQRFGTSTTRVQILRGDSFLSVLLLA